MVDNVGLLGIIPRCYERHLQHACCPSCTPLHRTIKSMKFQGLVCNGGIPASKINSMGIDI
jgi:hypothetical protein